MIIRVAPHYPILTWSVGTHGIEFMHFRRIHLPDLVVALERFVLDRTHGKRAYCC